MKLNQKKLTIIKPEKRVQAKAFLVTYRAKFFYIAFIDTIYLCRPLVDLLKDRADLAGVAQ